MKNHLTVIQGLIQKGRHEEVHDYMEKILANLNSSDEISASGYPVIDSLINYKFFHVGDDGIVKTVGDRLATTKSNPGVHGLGLRNVEDIVQKSGGIFDVEYDEEWFSVSVAFNG